MQTPRPAGSSVRGSRLAGSSVVEPWSAARRARGLALAAALALGGCAASDPGPAPMTTAAGVVRATPVAVDAAVRDGIVDAARAVGGALAAAEGPGHNTVVSPWSLAVTVAMLRVAAGDRAGAEIDALFGFPADAERRDRAMNAIVGSLARLEGDPGVATEKELPEAPVVHSAQAVFTQTGYAIGADYLDTLAAYYGTGVHQVDFTTSDGARRLDAWVARNTGGEIAESPLEPSGNTRMVLADAVLLAARWDSPFDAASTTAEAFTRTDASVVQVPTMHQPTGLTYAQVDGWQAVDLPYLGPGAPVMRLVLPPEGTDPTRLDRAGVQALDRTLETAESREVLLSLPKWDFEATVDLREQLVALGLGTAFSTEAGLYPGANPELFVSGAVQQATIRVDEEGTVAAAVTEIGMDGAAPPEDPLQVTFDRPFRFEILDPVTRAPLFLGIVADPSGT